MGDATVTQRVIDALAEAEGVEPQELDPPLYEAIETDALELLAGHDGEWYLQFTVGDCVVAVDGGDEVTVEVT
ncbi:HalOD1 output domain-containing protein [Halomicrobium salinisoli]|uniref:HalOD1 output domain-containing protein n=1 Tax=Halomicrobium salinisoli TaxID=2878391 RepID=UPI001CEFDE32|nr:HalOD1 output domain-containing protein [Halomicrobium salinisoli]